MNSRCILSKSLWHGQRKVRIRVSLSLFFFVPLHSSPPHPTPRAPLPVPLRLLLLTCASRLIGHDQYFIRSLKLPAPPPLPLAPPLRLARASPASDTVLVCLETRQRLHANTMDRSKDPFSNRNIIDRESLFILVKVEQLENR